MPKPIKTRSTVKNVKVLDKSIGASKRMKDAFVRTKDKAEETQSAQHATPTDYASDNIQGTTQSAARETVYNLHTPRHKVRENIDRAKGHFQEVKRHMPKERQQAAAQAQNTAQSAKSNTIKLRKDADHAFNRAQEAKTAVKDAKMALKEVKHTGRQTIREVKADAARNMKIVRGNNLSDQPANTVLKRSGVPSLNDSINAPNGSTLNSKLPRQRADAIKTRNSVKPINTKTNTLKINGEHPVSGASSVAERGITPATEFPKKSFTSGRQFRLSNLNPFRRKTTPTKAPDAKPAAPVKNTAPVDGKSIKDVVSHPSYTNITPKGTDKAAQTLHKSAESIKSTKKGIKETAKGTVKTAKKSVKTAEKTAKKAVKTAKQTAKTAQKTAKAAAKTAKTAERAARAAAKAAVQAAKVATKAVTAMVKAAIAAIKGLVATIAAGGWVVVLIILIICMIGLLVGSIFGIFFSSEPSESGQTINTVIAEIDNEYTDSIDSIIAANTYDLLDMSGARAAWKQVLAVYTVKTVTDPANPMEVATIDDTKAALLRSVFWEMNTISYVLDSYDTVVDILDDDGLPTGDTTTVTTIVLRISVTHKTPDEMAVQYGFTDEQKAQLEELLKTEYHSLWNALLYGITSIGDGSMISVAETQLGNVGGEPYWSWYGFTSRVEWCACFVSWVAEQCGFIDVGIIPRFSACSTGVQWFQNRGQWQDNTYTPRPGDIIFFDWEPDGTCDHVGIVESVSDGKVNTIEGNSSDSCRRRSYDIGSVKIYGYGTPAY